jgi:glucose/arabinose dehydrogenase
LRSLILLCATAAASAATVPAGFTVTTLASIGSPPTAAVWAGDGTQRLFVASQYGDIRVVRDGALKAAPFATLPAYHGSYETGLLGLACDPDFAHNGYLYAFLTVDASTQRIVRLADADGDDVADGPPVTIVDHLPTRGANHNGGALAFGPDGTLYWAIGDNGNADGANGDLSTLASKVGRVLRDGTAPPDNPHYVGDGSPADFVWAGGLRNPFTMCFRPDTGALWVDGVGNLWEQIFDVRRGDDCGDASREHQQDGTTYRQPIFDYQTNASTYGGCITGGCFYTGTAFPIAYRGGYFFGDYNSNQIMCAHPDGAGGIASTEIWSTDCEWSPLWVNVGPDGALYLGKYYNGSAGTLDSEQILRIAADVPPSDLILSRTELSLAVGGTGTVWVHLAAAPTGTLDVSASATGDPGVDLAATTFTFSPVDWSIPKPLLIRALQGPADGDADVTFSATALQSEVLHLHLHRDSPRVLLATRGALSFPQGADGTVGIRLA